MSKPKTPEVAQVTQQMPKEPAGARNLIETGLAADKSGGRGTALGFPEKNRREDIHWAKLAGRLKSNSPQM